MKRGLLVIFAILCLILCIGLVSCGGNGGTENGGNTENSGSVEDSGTPENSGSVEDNKNYVTITFDTKGGSGIDSVQVEKGSKIPKPQDPERLGYTFDKWSVDGTEWVFIGYVATEDMTLEASWTPTTYTIEYIGQVNHTNKTTYTVENELELSDSNKEYYEFLGWYEDQEYKKPISKIEKGTTGNLKLYGKTEYTGIILELNQDGYAVVDCDENATSIVIPESYKGLKVTSIGDYVFPGCTGLTSVVIPNSVTTIGEGAFLGCTSLTSIEIPNSVTTIGSCAFEGCTSLTSIEIPNSVTSIDEYAFNGCRGLTSIVIPNSVTSIGNRAFRYCTGLTSVVIPNSVTTIDDDAFLDCTSLTSVDVPNSVTSIGEKAFYGCTRLEEITLPFVGNGSDKTHFGYIFGASHYNYNEDYVPTSLKKVTITGGESIGEYAFYDCENLASITIGNSVTSIGEKAFYGCTRLEEITVPFVGNGSGKTHFGYIFGANSYSYNKSCVPTSLKKVTITGKTSISEHAFNGCTSLTSVKIPNSVTSIGNYAFYGCTGLTSIEIPNSVTSIGNYAFKGCEGLKEITIPFVGNGSDQTHFSYIFGASHYNYSEDYVPTSLKKVTITGGASISEYAFYDCENLTSITIGDSVTSIGDGAFYGCLGLEEITLPFVGNRRDGTHFGCIFGASSYLDNRRYVPTSLKKVTITSGASISEYAFLGCISLTSIEIPNSVTTIGSSAFEGCTSLTSIEIPNSVTTIGNYAFSRCTGLTSEKIPNSVTTIGEKAFYGCTGLTIYCEAESQPSGWNSNWNYSNCPVVWNCKNNEVADNGRIYLIDDGVRYSIYQGKATVERQSTAITTANIKEKIGYKGNEYIVTTIGDHAFAGCTGLTSIELPNSITTIGWNAFYGCTGLTSIIVDEGNPSYKSIDGNLYSKDGKTLVQYAIGKKDTSFVVPNGVTSIGDYAFRDCTSLTSIVIPNSVTSIGGYAFRYCAGLTIYCEAESQPSGWASDWNDSNRPVYWYSENEPTTSGNYWHYVDGEVTIWE